MTPGDFCRMGRDLEQYPGTEWLHGFPSELICSSWIDFFVSDLNYLFCNH